MRGPQTARTNRARSLRKADNDAEQALWSALKNRQLNGAKFTRQFPIGPYFADFACREDISSLNWTAASTQTATMIAGAINSWWSKAGRCCVSGTSMHCKSAMR